MIEISVEDFENKYVSRSAYDDLLARAEAAEKRVAELEAASRWIPIATGRLPEKGQECEVIDPAGYIHNWVHTDNLLNIFAKYTHWRPLTLPQPPQEGKE